MNYASAFLISLSILIPIGIGLIRLRSIKRDYGYIFLVLLLGVLAEIISFVLIDRLHASNAIPTNIFVLAEWILFSLQFRKWGLLGNDRLFYLLLSIPIGIWVIENLALGRIVQFSPFFRMLYSFFIVLMAISEINLRIIHDDRSPFHNPRFIICLGLILFYVYQILYEWAYQISVSRESSQFTYVINFLFGYINALTNIIFGVAFLVVPKRKEFRLH